MRHAARRGCSRPLRAVLTRPRPMSDIPYPSVTSAKQPVARVLASSSHSTLVRQNRGAAPSGSVTLSLCSGGLLTVRRCAAGQLCSECRSPAGVLVSADRSAMSVDDHLRNREAYAETRAFVDGVPQQVDEDLHQEHLIAVGDARTRRQVQVTSTCRSLIRGRRSCANRKDSPFALENQSDHQVVIPAQDWR